MLLVVQRPAVELFQQPLDLRFGQRRHAALTRDAIFLGQFCANKGTGLCGYCEGAKRRESRKKKRAGKPVTEDLVRLATVLRKEIDVVARKLDEAEEAAKKLTNALHNRICILEDAKDVVENVKSGNDAAAIERLRSLVVCHTHDFQGRAVLPLNSQPTLKHGGAK